jgi:hypothetical protein
MRDLPLNVSMAAGRGLFALALVVSACREGPVSYRPPWDVEPRAGRLPGEVVVRFQAVPGASSYRVERAPSPSGPWKLAVQASGTEVIVNGLPAGKWVYFRVSAHGPRGHSPSSLMAGCVAPERADFEKENARKGPGSGT